MTGTIRGENSIVKFEVYTNHSLWSNNVPPSISMSAKKKKKECVGTENMVAVFVASVCFEQAVNFLNKQFLFQVSDYTESIQFGTFLFHLVSCLYHMSCRNQSFTVSSSLERFLVFYLGMQDVSASVDTTKHLLQYLFAILDTSQILVQRDF